MITFLLQVVVNELVSVIKIQFKGSSKIHCTFLIYYCHDIAENLITLGVNNLDSLSSVETLLDIRYKKQIITSDDLSYFGLYGKR